MEKCAIMEFIDPRKSKKLGIKSTLVSLLREFTHLCHPTLEAERTFICKNLVCVFFGRQENSLFAYNQYFHGFSVGRT